MGDRPQPCAAVDSRPVVVSVSQVGLACVQCDPHLEPCRRRPRLRLQRVLDGCSRRYSVSGPSEDAKARVTLSTGPNDLSGVLRDRLFDQVIVACQCGPHRLRVRLPQPRRALDVGRGRSGSPSAKGPCGRQPTTRRE